MNNFDEHTLDHVIQYMEYAMKERKSEYMTYKGLYKFVLKELKHALETVSYDNRITSPATTIEELEKELAEALQENDQ